MRSPFVPVVLFVALVVSVLVALPLAGTAFVSLSFFGFMASLAGLGWWVVRTDRNVAADTASPTAELDALPEPLHDDDDDDGDLPPFEAPDWDSFERDFWIHVAEQETA